MINKPFSSLSEAKAACSEQKLCSGVTYQHGKFSLRSGLGLKTSAKAVSWVQKTKMECIRKFSKTKRDKLIEWDQFNPELRSFRGRDADGNCMYPEHIHSIREFDPNLAFTILESPAKCRKTTNSTLILFGIKSFPKNFEQRAAIRKTWLNAQVWRKLG